VSDFAPGSPTAGFNTSTGRFPDGADSDSNCNDFSTQAAASLLAAAPVGALNIKVANTEEFKVGQKITIDTGANLETSVVANVGTAGASTMSASINAGATAIPVASAVGFRNGQTVTIDGPNPETAVISSLRRGASSPSINLEAPLAFSHAAGTQVAGTGITLGAALTRGHNRGAPVFDNLPTPGSPNHYYRKPR
jgi:hypothetical protein